MNDLGKIAVISAIMGALLVVGLLLAPSGREVKDEVVLPAPAAPAVAEVTVVRAVSLEMLQPVYSEKGVYEDSTLRIAFNAAFDGEAIETRLPFWLHNTSGEAIVVLWERCSIQLPGGNTVAVLSEQGLKFGMGSALSIAPGGDLFDAVVPVSELTWTDTGYVSSTDVLDKGIFTLVLAIERRAGATLVPALIGTQDNCGIVVPPAQPLQIVRTAGCGGDREIVYYTFRFVIR